MKKLLLTLSVIFIFGGCINSNEQEMASSIESEFDSLLEEKCKKEGMEYFKNLEHNPQSPEFSHDKDGNCFIKVSFVFGKNEILFDGKPTNGMITHTIYSVDSKEHLYSIDIDPVTGEALQLFFGTPLSMEEWNDAYERIFKK